MKQRRRVCVGGHCIAVHVSGAVTQRVETAYDVVDRGVRRAVLTDVAAPHRELVTCNLHN